jgi:hypothetical protein
MEKKGILLKMARSIQHAKDCFYILGKDYLVVHKFLDQYVGIFPVDKHGDFHRLFLHNMNGIHLCRILYGLEGEKAAKVHIVRDWYCLSLIEKDMNFIEKNLPAACLEYERLADNHGRRRDHFGLKMDNIDED